MSRESFCNPIGDVKNDELEAWLVKTFFWSNTCLVFFSVCSFQSNIRHLKKIHI